MTGYTFDIVSQDRTLKRDMRFMTGDTTDSPIGALVALAVGEPIGLKSHIVDAVWPVQDDI
jgi:hypothetical protein